MQQALNEDPAVSPARQLGSIATLAAPRAKDNLPVIIRGDPRLPGGLRRYALNVLRGDLGEISSVYAKFNKLLFKKLNGSVTRA